MAHTQKQIQTDCMIHLSNSFLPSYRSRVTLLCIAQDLLAERISMRDRQALEYLVDVRFNSGGKGMLVEWHFVENPFFENKES